MRTSTMNTPKKAPMGNPNALSEMRAACDRAIESLQAQRNLIDGQLAAVELARSAIQLTPIAQRDLKPAKPTKLATGPAARRSPQSKLTIRALFDLGGAAKAAAVAKRTKRPIRATWCRLGGYAKSGVTEEINGTSYRVTRASRGAYALEVVR